MHDPDPRADLNPYASPRVADPAMLPVLPRERWPELQVQLLSIRKGVMQRWLTIGGDCEGEMHYNGWEQGEAVYVNNRLRGRGQWWDLSIVSPRIDFFVDAWNWQVPAWIEVQAGLALTLFRIKRFRLTVAGHVVYEEP
jgi:hypothetical protein